MNQLEQNILNLVESLAQVAGQLVASKNPAYAPLVSLGQGLIDEANKHVNPSAAPASALIGQAATDIAGGVTPVISAVQTVTSKGSTATQKAGAIGLLLGEIETIGGDVISFFHRTNTAPNPAPTLTPAPSISVASPGSGSA